MAGKSFLKWAGGKTRYADLLVAMAPAYEGVYREPFMGSAAVFFELQPETAILSDANEDLVTCFQEIKNDPFGVMAKLDEMPNTREYYETIRRVDRATLSRQERAAWVIYLNKTGFRGLWRVNRRGEFNVPYGEYDRPYYNRDTLLNASKILQTSAIECVDFESAMASAEPGDWVYLDPPYVPTGTWGDFTRYTPDRFPEEDHHKLASLVGELTDRGVYVLLTNSDTPFVRELYEGFAITTLATRRDIDLRSDKRTSKDLVVTNYTDFLRLDSVRVEELPRVTNSNGHLLS